MKLSLGKRLLMLVHWLLSVLICAAFAISLIAPDFYRGLYEQLESAVGSLGVRIIGIALLAVFLALAAAQVCFVFRRPRRVERGFITVESGKNGRVRIAVAAVEQMVRQSVHSIDGIAEMKIGIDGMEDSIAITVNASIVSGSHVPTITANMQRSIRQFVEMNCGVSVGEVSISINSVTNASQPSRKRFGRGRVEAPKQEAPVAASAEPIAEAGDGNGILTPEQPGSEKETEVCNESTGLSNETTEVYSFDTPYESQFARDLEALRPEDETPPIRRTAQTDESDAEALTSDGE